jgi:hypothetical protein
MKIKVLKDTKAASCVKGIKTELYLSGEVYDIFDELAEVFVKEGWGEKVEEVKVEEKALPKLENKAIEKVEEDKALEIKEVKKTTKKKSKK